MHGQRMVNAWSMQGLTRAGADIVVGPAGRFIYALWRNATAAKPWGTLLLDAGVQVACSVFGVL